MERTQDALSPLRLETLRPSQLNADDAALWTGFVAACPDQTGPYFDIRYVQAIGDHVPLAGVARFRRGGQVVGYFPYQLRGGALQPLGAPLTDYHGIIGPADLNVDFAGLLKATGAKRLEFQGWVGDMDSRAAACGLARRIADTSQGFDHWWKTQDAEHHKFFKNIGRCQRNVQKDFGGFAFTWERVTPEVLDWVIALKRDQYRKTAMHDVFACGWTRTLLNDLAAVDSEAFGLRAGVFRHDGKLVAAEISLVNQDEVHLWFPAYDPAYYRYTVGILLTVEIMRHMAAKGIRRFDFGTGGEDYKSPMTVPAGMCLEGELITSPRIVLSVLGRMARPGLRLSMQRRARLIRATETSLDGWGRALASLARRAVMRIRPAKA